MADVSSLTAITSELKDLNLGIAKAKLEKQQEVKPADARQQEAGKST